MPVRVCVYVCRADLHVKAQRSDEGLVRVVAVGTLRHLHAPFGVGVSLSLNRPGDIAGIRYRGC